MGLEPTALETLTISLPSHSRIPEDSNLDLLGFRVDALPLS